MDRNIWVRIFKPVQIIVWQTGINSFLNCNTCGLESITDIQYNFRDSMNRIYSNIDPE